ncbi:DUF3261 domain-containing protein [Alteromonas sp. 1_MG-2023]|uniref:DUF3261 domain-containing protein n=1 Tax=Alteromonas sp. 1_MG-2023 TaxID=3062669 RepID=UPI0026E3D37B|nr:DUF3261 domain-containing protein [Alteromonas sp. 1_MG-2023]MDO6566964.1 DUF3261 domain-containing protein [Alteromonas sp. 1_MG-2023]
MSKRLAIGLCFGLVLSACSALNSARYQAFPLLLLPPVEGPAPAVYQQRLDIVSQRASHQFLVVLKIDESEIKLRGLLPTGQSAYTINYDGKQIEQQSLGAEALPAEEILTMLQFALWPEESLRKFYEVDDGWLIETGPNFRLLSLDGQSKLKINYLENEQVVLDNLARQYKVKIETLEYKRL